MLMETFENVNNVASLKSPDISIKLVCATTTSVQEEDKGEEQSFACHYGGHKHKIDLMTTTAQENLEHQQQQEKQESKTLSYAKCLNKSTNLSNW